MGGISRLGVCKGPGSFVVSVEVAFSLGIPVVVDTKKREPAERVPVVISIRGERIS